MLNIKVGNLIRFNSDVVRTRNLHTVYRVVRVTPQGFFTALRGWLTHNRRGWLTHNRRGWNSHDSLETAFCPADLRDFHLVAKDIYSLPPEPEPLTGSYDVHKIPSRPKFACYEEELAFLLKDAPALSGIPTRHAYNRNDCYDLEVGAVVKLHGDMLCEYRGEKIPEGIHIVYSLKAGREYYLWGRPDVCSVVHLPSREGDNNTLSAREKALAELCKGAPVLPCGVSGGGGDAFLVLQAGDVVANRGRTVFHEYRGEKAEDGQYILYCLNSGSYPSRDTWWGAVGVFQLVHRRAPRRATTQPTEVKPEVATTPAPAPSVATTLLTRAEAVALGDEAPALPCEILPGTGILALQKGDVLANVRNGKVYEYRGERADGDRYILHSDSDPHNEVWFGSATCFKLIYREPAPSVPRPLTREEAIKLGKDAPEIPCEVLPETKVRPTRLSLKVGDVVVNKLSGDVYLYGGDIQGDYYRFCSANRPDATSLWHGDTNVFKLIYREPAVPAVPAKPSKPAEPEVKYLTPSVGSIVRHKTGSSLMIKKGGEFSVDSTGEDPNTYNLLSTTSQLRISNIRLLGDVWEVVPQQEKLAATATALADVYDCLDLKVGDVVRRLNSGLDLCEQKDAPFKVVEVLTTSGARRYKLQPILPGNPEPSATIERMGSGLCWEKVTLENSVRAGTRLQVLLNRDLDVRSGTGHGYNDTLLPQGTVVEIVSSGDDDNITVQIADQDGTVNRANTYRSLVLRDLLVRQGHSRSYCLVHAAAASQVAGVPSGATAGATSPTVAIQSSQASGTGEGCNFALSGSCATNTGAGGNIEFKLAEPKPKQQANILTHSGQLLDVLNPDPGSIWIGDIAHALSQKVRWGGHSERPITIAEHSVRVARVARYLCGEAMYDKDAALRVELAALLHDAAEAYIGDVPKPIKNALPVWDNQIENPLQHAILKAFNCEVASLASENIIKLADQLVNQIELETHMTGFWSLPEAQRLAASAYTGDRELLQRIAGDQSILGYDFCVRSSPPSVWESNFLKRFNELTEALAK